MVAQEVGGARPGRARDVGVAPVGGLRQPEDPGQPTRLSRERRECL